MPRELRTGDKGQRYEVRFIDNGRECTAGWTDDKDGTPLVEMINKHPVWHSPKVIDRKIEFSKENRKRNKLINL